MMPSDRHAFQIAPAFRVQTAVDTSQRSRLTRPFGAEIDYFRIISFFTSLTNAINYLLTLLFVQQHTPRIIRKYARNVFALCDGCKVLFSQKSHESDRNRKRGLVVQDKRLPDLVVLYPLLVMADDTKYLVILDH